MNYPRRPSEKESKVTHVSTCTLEGEWAAALSPSPQARRAARLRWLA